VNQLSSKEIYRSRNTKIEEIIYQQLQSKMPDDPLRVEKLTSTTNFPLWKDKVMAYAESKELLQVLLAAYDEPTEPEAKALVATLEAKVKTFLLAILDEEHHKTVLHCKKGSEIWTVICNLKESTSSGSKIQLRRELQNYRFSENQRLTEYTSGLNLILNKFTIAGIELKDDELIAKILDDLPSRFKNFKETYNILIEERTQEASLKDFLKLLNRSDQSQEETKSRKGEAFAVSKKEALCQNCGKKGHAKADCWSKKRQKRETPERKPRETQCPKERKEYTCFNCGKKGHTKSNCRAKPKGQETERAARMALATARYEPEGQWIADGGASFHMTSNKNLFSSYELLKNPIKISTASKDKILAVARGTIHCLGHNGEEWKEITINEVYHVPRLGNQSLFSLGTILDEGYTFNKDSSSIQIYNRDGDKIITGTRERSSLWILRLKGLMAYRVCLAKADLLIWHKRLGHTSKGKIDCIQREEAAKGMEISGETKELECTECAEGRLTRLPCKPTIRKSGLPGEHLSADLCGPMQSISLGGAKYFLLVKDTTTCYRQAYFLKTKEAEEVMQSLEEHIRMSKTQTGNKVKTLRTDNGSEFVNQNLSSLLKRMGIIHERTIPYTPEENGAVERDNRTIIEMARTMLHAADLPPPLWAELVHTAVYIHNRVPNRKDKRSPYEQHFGKTPRVDHLRIIGSDVFVSIPKEKRTKWDKVSWAGKLIGYGESTHFYRVFNPDSQKVKTTKDVKIFEPPQPYSPQKTPFLAESEDKRSNEVTAQIELSSDTEDEEEERSETKKEERQKQPSAKGEGSKSKNKAQPVRRSKRNSTKKSTQKQETDSEESASEDEIHGMVLLAEKQEPQTYAEAINDADQQKWKKAMKQEIDSLKTNQTWTLMTPPKGRKIIKNKWVYKIKRDRDGNEIYKARLVAKGFTQKEGIDYQQTYAPVVKYETVRIMLAIAANKNLLLIQFDVKTAFLYGTITEELYMDQPEGFQDGTSNVCRLNKGIYGLKQSPRAWNNRIAKVLIDNGLQQLETDNCIFVDKRSLLFVVLYVDDGLVIGKTKEHLAKILASIKGEFEITVSPVRKYIGLEIDQDPKGITIRQEEYIKKILKQFNMEDSNPVATPSTPEIKKSTELVTAPYREAVGALMFLANISRPDIAFATGKVARSVENPTQSDWLNVKRIMRYLKGTSDLGITYPREGELHLEAYCDSDYGGDEKTRKSTTGLIITLNDSPVIWASRLQRTVSISTTEAEYNALTEVTKEVLWTRDLLQEINLDQTNPTKIKCDNQSTLKIANNEEACRRTKHMAIKVRFVRDEIKRGTIETEHVPTKQQKADCLTKSLTKENFQTNRNSLKLLSKKTAIACLCVMILTNQVLTTDEMFMPHSPIVWRESKDNIVTGAELVKIHLQLISPCDHFKELKRGKDQDNNELIKWCETYYDQHIRQKLQAHQTSHKRYTRDLTSLLYMGASLGIIPTTALPIAIVTIVGIVIIGVIGYVKVSNRVEDLKERNNQLEQAAKKLDKNQLEIQEKVNKIIKTIDTMIEKHNNLGKELRTLETNMFRAMILTSEISSKISTSEALLEESLRSWKTGKVNEKLFRALDIEFPCNTSCPYELMTALSWTQVKDELEIGILALKTDDSKIVIEADPFILYDGGTCEIHYTGDTKLTIDESNYKCKLKEAKIHKEGFITVGAERCPEQTENPWNRFECGKQKPPPQIKTIGLNNIIYCKGHKIKIDSAQERECPDFAFALSITQNFTTEKFSFKAASTEINLHKKQMKISQQEIHTHHMPDLNPYEIEGGGIERLQLRKTFEEGIKDGHHYKGITIILGIAMIGIILWIKLKKHSEQEEPEQEGTTRPKPIESTPQRSVPKKKMITLRYTP
jgi:uncharacterized membrane-anchored protein YhcB (DUF1043 family)